MLSFPSFGLDGRYKASIDSALGAKNLELRTSPILGQVKTLTSERIGIAEQLNAELQPLYDKMDKAISRASFAVDDMMATFKTVNPYDDRDWLERTRKGLTWFCCKVSQRQRGHGLVNRIKKRAEMNFATPNPFDPPDLNSDRSGRGGGRGGGRGQGRGEGRRGGGGRGKDAESNSNEE